MINDTIQQQLDAALDLGWVPPKPPLVTPRVTITDRTEPHEIPKRRPPKVQCHKQFAERGVIDRDPARYRKPKAKRDVFNRVAQLYAHFIINGLPPLSDSGSVSIQDEYGRHRGNLENATVGLAYAQAATELRGYRFYCHLEE